MASDIKKSHSPNKNAAASMDIARNQVASKIMDLDEPIPGDRKAIFRRLEEDLTEQIRIAMRNQKNYTNLGDVVNSKK